MADANTFERDLKRFGTKLTEVLTDIHKEVCLETRLRIATKTPILTGRASASWNASTGAPDYDTQPESYLNPSGAPEDGKKNLEGYKLGDDLFVANGLHYIGDLNNGSSRKAPAGFIEATAIELHLTIPAVVNKVKERHGL